MVNGYLVWVCEGMRSSFWWTEIGKCHQNFQQLAKAWRWTTSSLLIRRECWFSNLRFFYSNSSIPRNKCIGDPVRIWRKVWSLYVFAPQETMNSNIKWGMRTTLQIHAHSTILFTVRASYLFHEKNVVAATWVLCPLHDRMKKPLCGDTPRKRDKNSLFMQVMVLYTMLCTVYPPIAAAT